MTLRIAPEWPFGVPNAPKRLMELKIAFNLFLYLF